jgi:hypothetical protein
MATIGTLRAGVGRADMTPPVGIAHVNWGARTHDRAEGIDLPLYATVLLLEQDGLRAAIVDLDFLLIATEESRRLRESVAKELGMPAAHVRLSFTHTHSGPPWATEGFGTQSQLPGMDLVPAYRDRVRAAIAEAARAALAALRPARSASGFGRSEVTVNRRLELPGGRVVVGQNWEGYRDPVVSVLRIDALDATPIATLVGYGTHPIVLAHENRHISPDYPGHLKRVVEQAMGGHCLFLQGCAGDQIPREALVADLGAPRRIGTEIGLDAARVAVGLTTRPTARRFAGVVESGAPLGIWAADELPAPTPVLAVESRRIALPVRNYGDVEALDAEAAKAGDAARTIDRSTATPAELAAVNFRAKRAQMSAHWGRFCANRRAVDIELHAIRIGDAVLIGAPLEPFARIGVEIRESGVAPLVHFGGYTNGWDGYVPNASDFESNGYEVEWATPYAPEAAAVLAGEAQRLAADLMARGGVA